MKYRKLKRKWNNSSKNKKMMILFTIILSVITVGYASLNQVLKITGYASIDTGDGMIFTSIGIKENNGAIVEQSTSIKAKTLVNTQVSFQSAGSITFNVSAQNQGTTDAKLIEIKGLEESNTKEPSCIQVSIEDHNIGEVVYPNQIKNFTITITSTCTSYSSKEFDLHFIYEKQETINGVLPTLGNAVEYLKNNEVSSDINTSPTDGLFAIGNRGELTNSTSPREYRYVGSDPDNYVWFNDELWRIIGIFDGKLKIIRAEKFSGLAYDNKTAGEGSATTEYASNDWRDARLQLVLNQGPYWNREKGSCPHGQYDEMIECDFRETGLTEDSKKMLAKGTWYLGGTTISDNQTAQMLYEAERGTLVYTDRATQWTGYVALMYASDYGFATSGGSTISRDECLSKTLYSWDTKFSDCYNHDWLHPTTETAWTLSQFVHYRYVYVIYFTGGVYTNSVYNSYAVYPAVYLLPSLELVKGTGKREDPYVLTLSP